MSYPRTKAYLTNAGYDFTKNTDPISRYHALLKVHGHEKIEVTEISAKARLMVFEKSCTLSLSPDVYKPEIPKKPKRNKKKHKKDKRFPKEGFYSTWEWKAVRYQALKKFGARCMLCGVTSTDARICVDHIKPRKKYPELALKLENLQVLCDSCNRGKSDKYEDDWRDPMTKMFEEKMDDPRS